MIAEGEDAPAFELPALVDGEHRRVSLSEHVGEDVVVLAFYPCDFNPACDDESDLDELDLFTMQKDVSVLGISPDSLYSHAAFADAYDLHVPLLADTRREVAERYDVAFEDDVGQRLAERAVFVVDHDGVVQFAWSTTDTTELPPVDEVKAAIADTGGDDTAFARYRVGHAHYTEGRRAFTSAMDSYADSEWMMAQSDFRRAREAFEDAADHFDSAVRFADDPDHERHYDLAEQKATALWQATDWLEESASKYSSGAGGEGRRLRDDAERPLESARDLGEPVDPDEWPPDAEADREHESILPGDDAGTELAADIDDEVAADEASTEGNGDADEADEIDDAELEAIQAELAASDDEPDELEEEPTSMVDAPPEEAASDPDGEDGDGGSGDIEGEVGEAELEELAAELAESQAAVEEMNEADGADGEGGETDDKDAGESADWGSNDLTGDLGADEEPADPLAPDESDPPADPDADLSGGSGPAATSGSLEVGPPDDGDDDFEEPQGASDEDLADIPTADELEGEGAGDDSGSGGDDESGGERDDRSR